MFKMGQRSALQSSALLISGALGRQLSHRNNGYAISTPTHEQYRGDGIASRALGYGIASIRVNGNDILAIYNAMKYAREICVRDSRPVLIEAMTYRLGHHSTSDDSSAYRSTDEVGMWQEADPILKLEKYLINRGWMNEDDRKQLEKDNRKQILLAFQSAESEKLSSPVEAYADIYDEMPPRIRRQLEEMKEHVQKYKEHYPLDKCDPL